MQVSWKTKDLLFLYTLGKMLFIISNLLTNLIWQLELWVTTSLTIFILIQGYLKHINLISKNTATHSKFKIKHKVNQAQLLKPLSHVYPVLIIFKTVKTLIIYVRLVEIHYALIALFIHSDVSYNLNWYQHAMNAHQELLKSAFQAHNLFKKLKARCLLLLSTVDTSSSILAIIWCLTLYFMCIITNILM